MISKRIAGYPIRKKVTLTIPAGTTYQEKSVNGITGANEWFITFVESTAPTDVTIQDLSIDGNILGYYAAGANAGYNLLDRFGGPINITGSTEITVHVSNSTVGSVDVDFWFFGWEVAH